MTNHPLDVDPEKTFDELDGPKAASAEPVVLPKEEEPVEPEKTAPIPPSGGSAIQPGRHVAKQLSADERGLLIGGSLEEQYRLAKAYCASGLMPKALNTPEKVLVGLQLCRELGLPAMTSIGKIMVVNGVPAIFGDLPLALVMRSGLLVKINEKFLSDEKGAALASVCVVQRRGQDPVERSFSFEEAKLADLLKNGIWGKYRKRMLQCRARAWALKDTFPDVLYGVNIGEYDFNATIENGQLLGAGSDKETVADELNKAYLKNETSDQEREGAGAHAQ